MKILEILELEQENTQIILHKEGLFIRVYERSAYLFTKHLKAYNITKKFYKNVKQEVVYLGFPQNSFSKIEDICKEKNLTVKEEKNHISTTLNIKITGLTNFTENEFVNWKNNIALIESEGVALSPRPHSLKENEIIEKLRNFSVVSKTPIDCQAFIVELQNELVS
jgi:hypothetical protein